MPQLDIIHTLTIFLCTWLTLHLMMQKIKTVLITKTPKIMPITNPQPKLVLPWT